MARDIFRTLKRMRKDIDRFLGSSFEDLEEKFPEMEGFDYPETDIEDKEDKVVITLDMPGLNKEDIDIDVEEETITVKAKRKKDIEEKKEDYYRAERGYTGFYRKLSLPAKVETESSKARYENGVLTIEAKKQKGQKKGNKIDIE